MLGKSRASITRVSTVTFIIYKNFCNIARYEYVIRKTFTMFLRVYIGIRKTLEIGSGTKPFITFLSLRFFDMGREKLNFFLCWLFHLTPPRAAHFVEPNWSRLDKTKNRLPSSRLESQHTIFFKFQNPQRFQAWRHSHPRSYFLSVIFIVTSLIVTSTPRPGEHMHSMCAPN